jgi:hypothetical protein
MRLTAIQSFILKKIKGFFTFTNEVQNSKKIEGTEVSHENDSQIMQVST